MAGNRTRGGGPRLRTVAALGGIWLLGVALIVQFVLPEWRRRRARERDLRRLMTCNARVKQLCLGLHMYAAEYDGQFPPDLYTLYVGDYGLDLITFTCTTREGPLPVSVTGPEDFPDDFGYIPGLNDSVPSPEIVPVIYGRKQHHYGGVVGYVDGHTQIHAGPGWMASAGLVPAPASRGAPP